MDAITDSKDMSLDKLREMVRGGAMQSMGSQRIVHDLVTEHQHQVGCSELGAWVTSTKQRASPLRSRFPESPKQVDPKTKSTALTPEALLLLGPRLTHREQGNLSTSCGSLHTLDCFIAPFDRP